MEVDVVAPRTPQVPQSPSLASMGEVEVSLDPQIPKDEKLGASVEDLVSVWICNNDPTKMVKVGSNLPNQHQEQLIEFLKENFNVFAWSHADMSGIPPSVACHKLNVDPHHWPVKQKCRTFNQERYDAIE